MSIHDVRLTGKREAAAGTKTFSFERPSGFAYRPGQFFHIFLPASAPGKEMLTHHFSFSSSPTEPAIEFTTRMTGSPFKERIDALEPGTVVKIDAPYGSFVLGPGMRAVAFVCGGIGVTPVRSTLRWAADSGEDIDVVAICADHDLESAPFREELDALSADTLRVVTVLSRPPEGWSGPTGHLDPDLLRRLVPDWGDRYFFVSGPPRMVRPVYKMLKGDVGIAYERLIAEEFPGYE